MSVDVRNQIEKAIQALNWVEVQRLIAVALLFGVVACASGQTVGPKKAIVQQDAGTPVIQVQSRLVVVRVMVLDKKVWRNGSSPAGQKCAASAQFMLEHLPATEPYLPPDCDGLYIRGLAARDFHVLVDGEEQKIQSITSESEGLRVRDNQGRHIALSQTPTGEWATPDFRGPLELPFNEDYGLLAQNRYDIAFVPGVSNGCHKISVQVNRRNVIVAARDEYCSNESPSDILNGSDFGNELEQDLVSDKSGDIELAVQAASFRGQGNNGLVRIALEFPSGLLRRQWSQDWTLQASIGVLGVVYNRGGTTTSKFSDFGCCTQYSTAYVFGLQGIKLNRTDDLGKQLGIPTALIYSYLSKRAEWNLPTRYETQVNLSPGEYDLRVVFGDGEKFGRAEAHLKVDSYDATAVGLSSVMLCNRYRDAHAAEVETKTANFAPQYVPMVSKGVEFSPSGKTTFSSSDTLIAYFELYKPQLATGAGTKFLAHLRIVDAKSGSLVKDFPAVDAATYEQPGSDVIPIAREIPISELPKGQYRLEVQASDASGHTTPWSQADFSIE